MSTADLQAYAAQAAQANGVPVNMFLWQIGQESGWNPNATNSTSTATGLGQFVQGTAAQFGINPTNPYQSLDAAAKYDAQLYQQNGGDWAGALRQYGTLANASSDTMAQFQNALGADQAPQTPAEAKAYYDAHGYAYTPPAASGSVAESFQKGFLGNISQYIGQGTFIILGIVVVAVAILSNKQVQTIAMKGV